MQNQRTKGSQIPNTKCELHTNQRESHKSNLKVATHQERAITKSQNQNRQQTSLTIPNCNSQISNYQMKRESFSHTLSFLSLSLSLSVVALCLYRRLESANISKTKKDQTSFPRTKGESLLFQKEFQIKQQTRLLIKLDNFKQQ